MSAAADLLYVEKGLKEQKCIFIIEDFNLYFLIYFIFTYIHNASKTEKIYTDWNPAIEFVSRRPRNIPELDICFTVPEFCHFKRGSQIYGTFLTNLF